MTDPVAPDRNASPGDGPSPRRAGLPDLATLAGAHEEIANLKIAVERRTLIGEAIGILMERYDINRTAAFAAISRRSQDENRKLYDVADKIAQRGKPQH